MGFSRQEYWSGLPFPCRLHWQSDSLPLGLLGRPRFISNSHLKLLGCVQLLATPWTVAHQAPLSMGFSRQEYWSGLPFPSPGDLPDTGIEPRSPTLQEGAYSHLINK